jgi:hypothetical protein
MYSKIRTVWAGCLLLSLVSTASADVFSFSTGNVDGGMAMASRPDGNGKIEIEAADDFILPSTTSISSATFTGLITRGTAADISQINVEIYRVFPKDSGVPSGNVPTRVNSPSDVAFNNRDTAGGGIASFSTALLSNNFTATNSVLNGINKLPNQTTGGEGPVTGTEVLITVNFATPFTLPPDHYFFVPQVLLSSPNEEFYWLSAVRPIVAPGTPFAPDLQAWIRNANLDPDWLRVGTDIVGAGTAPAPTFNGAFTLQGSTIAPEPSALALGLSGAGILVAAAARRKKRISYR